VTRGKRLVVVVGQRQALAIAVKGSPTRRRWSKLGEWLGRLVAVYSQRQITGHDR
jgi:exodeoxyribonuclease V alpha subunit